MKWCPSCRKEFADEVNFCKFCGAKLEEKAIHKALEKAEYGEKAAVASAERERSEHLEQKESLSGKKILIAAGILIILIAGVFFLHGGRQEDTEDQMMESSAEEQQEDIQKAEEPVEPAIKQEIGWVQTAGGADFYVPEGFVQVEQNISFADAYRYENEGLGMYIEVWEVPFSAVSETETPQEIIKKDYYQILNMYGGFVGYSVERDDFCVCSANDGDEISYMKFINVRDEIYSTVSFAYPVETRETCDSILEEFLDTLEYD